MNAIIEDTNQNEIAEINSHILENEAHALTNAADVTPALIQAFLNDIDAKPQTKNTYRKQVKQFLLFLQANGITRPTRGDIVDYRETLENLTTENGQKRFKATTVQNYLIAVKRLFSWTDSRGLYPNVAAGVKGEKISRNHKKSALTGEQVVDILKNIKQNDVKGLRDYAIFLLTVSCGLRTIEVVRANIEDLTTAGGHTVLYVQGKDRDEKGDAVRVPATAEKAIRRYLATRPNAAESEPLFVSTSNNNRGKRITTRAVSDILKGDMKSAGYNSRKLTAHSLRHTAITLAYQAGKTPVEVQQFARHRNFNTTMIYIHENDAIENACADVVEAALKRAAGE